MTMTDIRPEIAERTGQKREDRTFSVEPIELREGEGTEWPSFEGVASSIDKPYTVRDRFGEFSETIKAGAFKRTLAMRDKVDLLYNHDRNFLLATTKNGSLSLEESPDLAVRASLNPDDPDVQKIAVKMRDGRLDEMSIGFRVREEEWNDDYTERTITEVQLFDVSVVNTGASPFTGASLRAIDQAIQSLAEADVDPDELRQHIEQLRQNIAELEQRLPSDDPAEPVIHPDLVAASHAAALKLADLRAPL